MFEPDAGDCCIAFDHFDPKDEIRREALFALANGLLSCRASAPEAAPTFPTEDEEQEQYAGFYRAGWYDEAEREINGTRVNMGALVNLPNPFGLSVRVNGKWLDRPCVDCCDYHQRLNMRDGVLERRLGLDLGGHEVILQETRFISMANPHLAVLRWELTLPEQVSEIDIRSLLDGGVINCLIDRNRSYEGKRLHNVEAEHDVTGRVGLSASLTDPQRRIAMGMETRIEGQNPTWTGAWDGSLMVQQATCAVPAGSLLVIEKRVVVAVADSPADTARAARSKALTDLPEGAFFSLIHEHRKAWWALWARMPLRCSDKKIERTLHFHAFHLLQTVSPHSIGRNLGCPSRGWQEAYYGQVFWDQILAFPFLSTHFPELGRELLDYRYRRLDVARERARRHDLRGAMYPWRSARSGEDETPPFQYNPISGRWMVDDTRLQHHVGAAIAYDIWQLYLCTGDPTLLAGFGGEMFLEIARFWSSIAEFDASRGRYVIRGVIGPDEYHNRYPDADEPGLNNNAYTNMMAVWTLTSARHLLEVLPPAEQTALRDKLQIDDRELARWDDVSRRMYLPFRDDGVLSEFEGFDDLQEPPAAWLADNRPRLDWMLEAKGDSCDLYQLTKQADVLMLLHLFTPEDICDLLAHLGYSMSVMQLKRTVSYHLAHITHESSLSRAVCAGALARFDSDESWRYFQRTLEVDLEAKSDQGVREGVHLGAMSGALDTLQRHYLGLRPTFDGLRVFPSIPRHLPDVEIGLMYRGARLGVIYRDGALSIESEADNRQTIRLLHADGSYELAPGQSLAIRLR